jgi:hypothetical protein
MIPGIKKYLLMLVAQAALVTACNKSDDTETNLPAANYMTATISGNYWVADDVARSTDGGDTIRFTGSRSSSKPVTIQLVINKYRGPGVYKLNDTLASAVYTDVNGTYTSYAGTVAITTDDAAHTAANFEIEAQAGGATKTITGGQLNVKK